MASNNLGFIDLHHHVLPDFYLEALYKSAQVGGGGGGADMSMPPWSVAGDLAMMDEAEISTAVVSLAFGTDVGNSEATKSLARQSNEYIAELVRDRPDRFGGFAALPLPDVDAALAEIAYVFDELHLDGVLLMSNTQGTYLGDSRFDAVLNELQARKATVFAHPHSAPETTSQEIGLPGGLPRSKHSRVCMGHGDHLHRTDHPPGSDHYRHESDRLRQRLPVHRGHAEAWHESAVVRRVPHRGRSGGHRAGEFTAAHSAARGAVTEHVAQRRGSRHRGGAFCASTIATRTARADAVVRKISCRTSRRSPLRRAS